VAQFFLTHSVVKKLFSETVYKAYSNVAVSHSHCSEEISQSPQLDTPAPWLTLLSILTRHCVHYSNAPKVTSWCSAAFMVNRRARLS